MHEKKTSKIDLRETIKVLTAFRVFDPTAVPKKNGVGCKQYGIADVDLLRDFFYQDREDKVALKEELLSECTKFKYNLLGMQSQLPEMSNFTKFHLSHEIFRDLPVFSQFL